MTFRTVWQMIVIMDLSLLTGLAAEAWIKSRRGKKMAQKNEDPQGELPPIWTDTQDEPTEPQEEEK